MARRERSTKREKKEGLLQYIIQTLKVAEKPSFDQAWTTFKVTITGFLIVGIIGFLVQYIGLILEGGG